MLELGFREEFYFHVFVFFLFGDHLFSNYYAFAKIKSHQNFIFIVSHILNKLLICLLK